MSNIDWSQLITAEMKEAAAAEQQALLDAEREGEWKAAEMVVVADQLMALEEVEGGSEDVPLLPGSRQQWLSYRTKVRTWGPGIAGFPDKNLRPKRPE